MMKRYTTISSSDSGGFCLHHLNGVTEIPKRCLLRHECSRCGFDQWLEETRSMQGSLTDNFSAGSKVLAA